MRLAAYLSLVILLLPVQVVGLAANFGYSRRLPRFFHRLSCRILGFRPELRGAPTMARPALFVSNHSSYLDIIVLGSLMDASFVAKREVSQWPLFGLLAKLSRTVFVDRQRASAPAQNAALQARLKAGDALILFPEGTSSDGNRVLAFKSALFAATGADGTDSSLTVQPISIVYTRLDGLPLGRSWRPFYAWYGDMSMGGHLWRLLGFGSVTVSVTFHPPVNAGAYPNRKELARYCERVVAEGVSAAVTGRPAQAAA